MVRGPPGEHPDNVARLVQELHSVYAHLGDWSTTPAPGCCGAAFRSTSPTTMSMRRGDVEGELEGDVSEVDEWTMAIRAA